MKIAQTTKYLPPLRLKAWMTLVLPLALALSFLIATGGELQRGLTSALMSDASSLYAGAYGEGISKFPELGTWLLWGLNPVPVLISLGIITIALYARTVLLASLLIGTGTFLALTIIDVLGLAFTDDATMINNIGVSIAANFVAGCAIGFSSVLALKVFSYLWRKSSGGADVLLLFPAGILAASVTASTLLYLVLFFFFHPTDVHLEVRLNPPSRGFFISSEERIADSEGEGDGEDRMFSIVPPRTAASGAEATLIDARPILRWTAPTNGAHFNAELTVVMDCPPYQPFERMKDFSPNWRLDNVKSLSLEMDEGQSYVFVDSIGGRDYTLDVQGGALFWLKADGQQNKQTRSVEAFVQPPSEFTVRGGTPLRFFLSAPLTDLDEQTRTTTSMARTMRLKVNGKTMDIVAGGSRKFRTDSRLQCRIAAPSMDTIFGNNRPLSEAFLIGILVEITQVPEENRIYLPEGGRLSLTGLAGPVEIFEPSTTHSSDQSLGTASGIAVIGNVSHAQFDGTEVAFNEDDGLQGYGHFKGYLDEGGYEISGVAKGLWRDQRRVNPTRWERMPTELQAALLGAFGLVLLGLGRLLIWLLPHLKRDEELFLRI